MNSSSRTTVRIVAEPPAFVRATPWGQLPCTQPGLNVDRLFFSQQTDRDAHEQAAALCGSCPAAKTCADHARRNREWGTWGGETEARRALAGRAPRYSRSARARAQRAEAARSSQA